jgi:hypothetical protein
MRISKTLLWLSRIDALLVLLVSTFGIFFNSTYARETPSWAIQGMSQDIVNLIAVVVLLIATYFLGKGSTKAFLVWLGALVYLLYAYSIYAFDVHYNRLFLAYVAILGLSFYALVGSMLSLRLTSAQYALRTMPKARLVSVFLGVVALVFYGQWLGEDIPALISGKTPPSVLENGLPTNPVHVLDDSFLLPALVITAILLWRRQPLGSLLAIPLLLFSLLISMGILAIFVVSGSKGLPTSLAVELFIAVISVASLGLCIVTLRDVTELNGVNT